MKLIPLGKSFQLAAMYPDGPAELGGMRLGDEIIGVNGFVLNNDIESWLLYFAEVKKEITFLREGKIRTLSLNEVQRFFYGSYFVIPLENKNSEQEVALKLWSEL
jgi:predicted metalloprotease with PDZ domain